jgi:outer membrane receptor protein involved in Fe transport
MKFARGTTLIFVLMGILLFTNGLFAGTTGKIAGYITDAETGGPIVGANVIVEGTVLGNATDVDGYYAILNVPPGNYTLKISVMGYEKVTVRNVVVKIDLTTTVSYEIKSEALEFGEILVVAERPVVAPDVSSSEINLSTENIEALPATEIDDIIGLQAGVEVGSSGIVIRGGAARQTAFIVDGMIMNDERSNEPYTSVNLNSIEELKLLTGGFNAEYGNIRSGVVTLVTKEGNRSKYNGSIDIKMMPPTQKYFGESIYSANSYFLKPYTDPEVCYTGTDGWDDYTRKQYPAFQGWNSISQATLNDRDPGNDLTPEAAKHLFEWQHRRQGDITEPDYRIDAGFGGPLPLFSEYLGNLRFYASYHELKEMFIIPLSYDSYFDNVAKLKLNADITSNIKLTLNGQYGITKSASPYTWTTTPTGRVLRTDYEIANLARMELLYMPGWYSPTDITHTYLSAKINQILSSDSFYELNIQYSLNDYNTYQMSVRDTSEICEVLPSLYADEAPYGYWGYGVSSIGDNSIIGGWMNLGRDSSKIATLQLKFDYVNQINKTNEIKAGGHIVLNDYDIQSSTNNWGMTTWNREQVYRVKPNRIGAYIQDKLEYEGMIANLGLRMDYSNANTVNYILEDYDELLKEGNGNTIEDVAPTEKSKPILRISPRLGISHPITENSKFYFNYGHFQSEPSSTYRFRIQREYSGKVTSIGNPNLDFERTIAYEVGYSHNLFDQYLLNIAGYYKDISSQIGWITYTNLNNSVVYSRSENNFYEDVRGIEITLDKRKGEWITGFINYTYMVNTSGYFGLLRYYEDPNLQRDYESRNLYQERPEPRPYFRANLVFRTPEDFGPSMGIIKPLSEWNFSFLFNWKAGAFTTYNPDNILGVGVINNVQWKDTYFLDLRISKMFDLKRGNIQIYADIDNLLNTKFLSYTGFSSYYDYLDYMESLCLPWESGDFKGNDRIGEYRDWDVEYDPLVYNPTNDPVVAAGNEKRKETKSYIDMPNIRSLTFLNPRMIHFGIRISF